MSGKRKLVNSKEEQVKTPQPTKVQEVKKPQPKRKK